MTIFDPIVHALPADCRVEVRERSSIVTPYCLSHGTLECADLAASRRFYEEFLGLECAQHAVTAMSVRLGMRFHIVCVQVGPDAIHPCQVLNHWGVDVTSRVAVDEAHDNALKYRETYGIRQVLDAQLAHGVYSFYFEDLDHNWWEIQNYDNGFLHDDFFDFGDRFGRTATTASAVP